MRAAEARMYALSISQTGATAKLTVCRSSPQSLAECDSQGETTTCESTCMR